MTRQGWECPKCGSVWAPHIGGCNNCNALLTAKQEKAQHENLQQYKDMVPQPVPRLFSEPQYPSQYPYGPGMMAPNAQYDSSRRTGYGDSRWGGKAVTIIQPYLHNATPPGTK